LHKNVSATAITKHSYKLNLCKFQKAKRAKEGLNVGPKELFDATHMKDTPDGKVYINDKAKKAAVQLFFLCCYSNRFSKLYETF
jgi:hypothetical protein